MSRTSRAASTSPRAIPRTSQTNISQLRDTSLATGAAASQVLTSSTELEQQASMLKSQVDEFLSHVRVA